MIIKVNSFHGFGNEALFFPFDRANSIFKSDIQRYLCLMYLDSPSLVVRASCKFSYRVVFCWKTLFQGLNVLFLEVPFSPACPSRIQPFAVPMGLWWEGASSRGALGSICQVSWWKAELRDKINKHFGNQLYFYKPAGLSHLQHCSGFNEAALYGVNFLILLYLPCQDHWKDTAHYIFICKLTLEFFNSCQNYSLVQEKPTDFVHYRSNLAMLHSLKQHFYAGSITESLNVLGWNGA